MKEKVLFETEDGKVFEEKDEAEKHERGLSVLSDVEVYVTAEHPELEGRHRTRHINAILGWESYRMSKETQAAAAEEQPPAAEKPAAKKAAAEAA